MTNKTSIWTGREGQRPRVVIMGAPNRDRVRTELGRVRGSIQERAEIVVEDLNFEYDFQDPI